MPIQSKYPLLIASMDVDPDKEALFHEVYDQEHVPVIKGVPGVLSVARFQRQDLTLVIGGERRTNPTGRGATEHGHLRAGECRRADHRRLGRGCGQRQVAPSRSGLTPATESTSC